MAIQYRRSCVRLCLALGLVVGPGVVGMGVVGAVGTAAAQSDGTASAAESGSADNLPAVVDSVVPPPVGSPSDLQAAIMPSDVGDPFFDRWPNALGDSANGDVLESRDVTGVAAPFVGAPVREVRQLKVRTTDATGNPSFATATLIVPAAAWAGPGPRPVLVNNVPIDGLGRACTPSFLLSHGLTPSANVTDFVPPTTALAAQHGYAVLIPDHEGPRMAYAEPFVAGHAVLDSIRGMRRSLPDEFGDSRIAMVGYSGGAIATHGAVKLIDSYAPELADHIAGAALGGVPADFEMLTRSMNGNLATGLFHGAVFGIARERPQILDLANNLALRVAMSPLRDHCDYTLAAAGATFMPIEAMSAVPHPLDSAVAQDIYRTTAMAGVKSGTPLYIYNGAQEFWIPAQGARNLFAEQCGLGVRAVYREVLGEHGVAAVTGFPGSVEWLDQRLRGLPAPDEC
ncbi:cutinase family protein [Rhodococcus spelaei]|uniref:Cutinase family protein n=1 Tax=Rhodococcus spelaei TaxID=2546320 RepID=A0A541BRF9_9NOCA|nr:lipase family protein [Rhodococcus spelaei]TQF74904.1 cutinase family protein [Rhodococcus spelaei]